MAAYPNPMPKPIRMFATTKCQTSVEKIRLKP